MLRRINVVLITFLWSYQSFVSAAFLKVPRYANTTTSIQRIATENTTSYGNGDDLGYASACDALEQSWHSVAATATQIIALSTATITTMTPSIDEEYGMYTRTQTFLSNSTAYTLCDGYPRLDGYTTTSTWQETTTHTYSELTVITTTEVSTKRLPHGPSPTCSIASKDCSALCRALVVGLVFLQHKRYPLLARPMDTTAASLWDDVVPSNVNSLMYWPVTTMVGGLCNGNASTMTMGPTISGRPNTFVTLNTTLTSPTVYIAVDGAWGYSSSGTTFANQTRLLLKHSSDAVSSICAKPGGGYGTPQAMNYADFNYPVPASAYRCQPKCFEQRISMHWTQLTNSAPPIVMDGTTYKGATTVTVMGETVTTLPDVNLCSTIWDDYRPGLAVPQELLDLSPTVALGGGLSCYFTVDSNNIFFDPPKPLTQASSVVGPTTPAPVFVSTTSLAPTVTAEPAGSQSDVTAYLTSVPLAEPTGTEAKGSPTSSDPAAGTLLSQDSQSTQGSKMSSSVLESLSSLLVGATDPSSVESVTSTEDQVEQGQEGISTSVQLSISSVLESLGSQATSDNEYPTTSNAQVASDDPADLTVSSAAASSSPGDVLTRATSGDPDSSSTSAASSIKTSRPGTDSQDIPSAASSTTSIGIGGLIISMLGATSSTTAASMAISDVQSMKFSYSDPDTQDPTSSPLNAAGMIASLLGAQDPSTDVSTDADRSVSGSSTALPSLVITQGDSIITSHSSSATIDGAGVSSIITTLAPAHATDTEEAGEGNGADSSYMIPVSYTTASSVLTAMYSIAVTSEQTSASAVLGGTQVISQITPTPVTGLVISDSGGIGHTIVFTASGAMLEGSGPLTSEHTQNLPGLGTIVVQTNGIVLSGSTITYSGLSAMRSLVTPAPEYTLAGLTLTMGPSSVMSLSPGAMLIPGGSAVTLSGHTVSMDASGSGLVIDGTSTAHPSYGTPVANTVITLGTHTYTALSDGRFSFASGAVASAGEVVTFAGTTVSLDPSGSFAVANGETQRLPEVTQDAVAAAESTRQGQGVSSARSTAGSSSGSPSGPQQSHEVSLALRTAPRKLVAIPACLLMLFAIW
ncbi:hypothetical protein LTR27_007443 [Elasticomyces elasticus]|nr:hypothetical protein LTR27_007443 [Elasticomyces elasticus]